MAKTSGAGAGGGTIAPSVPAERVVMVPCAKLNPAPYNPRKMSAKEAADLRASITKFGLVDPCVVNEYPGRENVVIGGHMRLRLWTEMGHATIPCVYVSLPEDEERELNVRLNLNNASWDYDALANWEVPKLIEWGFEKKDLAFHFDIDATPEPNTADAMPDEQAPVRARIGSVFQCGEHIIVCGDSTKPETYAAILDGTVDFVFTSPPYNVGIKYCEHGDTLGTKDYLVLIENVVRRVVEHLGGGAGARVAGRRQSEDVNTPAARDS